MKVQQHAAGFVGHYTSLKPGSRDCLFNCGELYSRDCRSELVAGYLLDASKTTPQPSILCPPSFSAPPLPSTSQLRANKLFASHCCPPTHTAESRAHIRSRPTAPLPHLPPSTQQSPHTSFISFWLYQYGRRSSSSSSYLQTRPRR